jgi:hypothetical protein
MVTLPMQIAKEAVLPAAKGKKRHGRSDPNIDADIARFGLGAKLASGGTATGKQAGHVTPRTAIDQGDRGVHRFYMHQPQYRAKDFGAGDFAIGRHILQNRGFDKIPLL